MANVLSNLHPPVGAVRNKTRKGRGVGSGLGKTAGKGQKGQKAWFILEAHIFLERLSQWPMPRPAFLGESVGVSGQKGEGPIGIFSVFSQMKTHAPHQRPSGVAAVKKSR